jgi:hypothetical protein
MSETHPKTETEADKNQLKNKNLADFIMAGAIIFRRNQA